MQEVTGSSPVPSTTSPQTFWSGDFFRGGRYRTRTARPRRRRGNKHPSGVFVSARFPMRRNVYQERCRQTFWSGAFLLRHPLTHVGAGRYRTRTARAERSEGNQSPSGALISARFPMRRNVYQERCRQTFWSGDFFRGGRYRTRTGRPRRRRGNKYPSGALISARFPTHRNVYQERCRQTFWSGAFFCAIH